MPRESKKASARLSSKETNSRSDNLNLPSSLHSSAAQKDPLSPTAQDDGQQQMASTIGPESGTSILNIPTATIATSVIPLNRDRDRDRDSWNYHFSPSPTASSGSPPYHVQTIPRFSSHYNQRWPLSTETNSTVRGYKASTYNSVNGVQQHGHPSDMHWFSNTTPEGSPPDTFLRHRSPQSMSQPSHWPRSPPRQFASMAWAGNSATDLHGGTQHSGKVSLSPPSKGHFTSLADGHLTRLASSRDKDVLGTFASFCAIDTLQAANVKQNAAVENVVIVGSTGRVDIHGLQLNRIHSIGRLEGLRGTVLQAKILSSVSRRDPLSHLRPLLALVIHGPHLDGSHGPLSKANADQGGEEARPPQDMADFNTRPALWQTTVEVYSLKNSAYVTSLYMSGPEGPPDNLIHPLPHDDLRLDADGQYLVITSGKSGEIFIFAPRLGISLTKEGPFECVGKVWTSVHKYHHGSRPNTRAGLDVNHLADTNDLSASVPIFSLSQRYLAYVPPSYSARHAINGTICGVEQDSNIPGLRSFMPPASPVPNCAVDVPVGDSLVSQIARGVTQELIRGANWVSTHSIQAWRNYWNPNTQQQQAESLNNAKHCERGLDYRFPPTHADPSIVSSQRDTGCVSLLDLAILSEARKFASKSHKDPIPFATFPAPLGCSFVSLSPSGLILLTVSRDGDVQHVWDLMRSRQRNDMLKGIHQEREIPRVRQVAKFSRLTNANVVDVVWSEPGGKNFAILTAKGTAHVFSLASVAFQWPPPMALTPPKMEASTADGQGTVLETDTISSSTYQPTQLPLRRPSGVTSAVQSLSHRAQPLVNAVRHRTTSGSSDNGVATSTSTQPGAFSNSYFSAAAAGGAKGSKAVVSGVAKSISAAAGTVNQLRSPEEARFRLSLASPEAGTEITNRGAVRFLTGHERGQFGAVSASKLGVYALNGQNVKPYYSAPSSSSSRSSMKSQSKEHFIHIPQMPPPIWPLASTSARHQIISGFWSLDRSRDTFNSTFDTENKALLHPLSFAELETSSPFQPIYTDRRVTLSTFAEESPDFENTSAQRLLDDELLSKPSSSNAASRSRRNFSRPALNSRDSVDGYENSKVWTFGGDIASIKLDVGLTTSTYSTSLQRAEDFFSGTAGGIETIRLKKTSASNTDMHREKVEAETDKETQIEPQEFFEQDCTLLELEE